MTKIYSEFARVYHEMYQNIFDYKKEFEFYHKILKENFSTSILEIGCGSGNLAQYFLETDYDYVGLDLSQEMLNIAKEVEPKAKFIQADMRDLKFQEKFDAVIISGRSFTYLTTNEDVHNTLISIYKVLEKEGILIFDNFNAEKIISYKKKHFKQKSEYNSRKYTRISVKTPNLKDGWTENWEATYYIEEKAKKTKIFKDKSILRSFTKDELKLFLSLHNFEIVKLIDQDIIFTIIARKKIN
ncbi:MAG: class I SAM-dependent methyltransferase [Candidatus Cloacimonetes bacterium]|nr:class I SAM-dependent methyltransferase [Candidatus Cloacimonadota bacterium]